MSSTGPTTWSTSSTVGCGRAVCLAQRKRRFDTRGQAEAFDAQRRVDPVTQLAAAGRALTVDELMATWLATKANLPGLKTGDIYRTDHREVLLTWAGQLAAGVTPTQVRLWVARDRGQSLRERSLRALRQAYQLAIADGLLKVDPTAGVRARDPRSPTCGSCPGQRSRTWRSQRATIR